MTDDEITAAAKVIYFACSVTGHPSEHEWYGYYMFESIYHKAARALDAAGMLRPVAEPTTRNEDEQDDRYVSRFRENPNATNGFKAVSTSTESDGAGAL
jgi:hypothetical protein